MLRIGAAGDGFGPQQFECLPDRRIAVKVGINAAVEAFCRGFGHLLFGVCEKDYITGCPGQGRTNGIGHFPPGNHSHPQAGDGFQIGGKLGGGSPQDQDGLRPHDIAFLNFLECVHRLAVNSLDEPVSG